MTVVATDTQSLSNWLKYEEEPSLGLCHEVVTINQAASTALVTGTVLGKVTADGKYKVAVETAIDGSKVADAIYIGSVLGKDTQTVAAATDTKILVLKRGKAIVSKGALLLDATYNDDVKKNAVYASLEALAIFVQPTI